MILLRGIKGEPYARKIEKGIVDCRDVLSALLDPPKTGYEYSDYYEKNLCKAITFFTGNQTEFLKDPDLLYSLLIDTYIPHIYLTYFHVLSSRSLEWLNSFEDDYSFVALNVKLDRLTGTVIGDEYFGSRMTYVNSISELSQDGFNKFYAACMCSIENLFEDKAEMNIPLQIYNTLFFPLLCREQDEKYTDIENEFRLIAYDCPRIRKGVVQQIPRNIIIKGHTGVKYEGILESGTNTVFESDLRVLKEPKLTLRDLLIKEEGKIVIDSLFKPINISGIASDYRYLGDKANCEEYIKKTLKNMPEDIYINRTVLRKHTLNSLNDVCFLPSHQIVKY